MLLCKTKKSRYITDLRPNNTNNTDNPNYTNNSRIGFVSLCPDSIANVLFLKRNFAHCFKKSQ